MSLNESRICSFRYCNRFVQDAEIRQGIRLCRVHFNKEKVNIDVRKSGVLKKLNCIISSAESEALLRDRQSSLAAEVEEINDTFNALQENLRQWRLKIVSRVQAAHDSVASQLGNASEAQRYEKELTNASRAGDLRNVMKLTAAAELWLEESVEARLKLPEQRNLIESSMADLSSWVQQLNFIIDRHMVGVMAEFWLDDGHEELANKFCQPMATIDDLDYEPCHLTCCSNTAGFGSDSSGRIIKCDSTNTGIDPLPQPCIFVSFDWKSADYLLVISLDGTVRLKYHTELDNNDQCISGLHCDNERQLLFVAQILTVTVTDLCGEVKHVITEDTLNQEALYISAIGGNAQQVFLFNLESKCILVIGKTLNHDLERIISVGSVLKGQLNEILLHEKEILLVDDSIGKVYRINGLSGETLSSIPQSKKEFFSTPCHATIDKHGRLFVAETENHTVRVYSGDDTLVETLGKPGQAGDDEETFRCPDALTVIDAADEGQFLVVADSGNFRIRVFLLR